LGSGARCPECGKDSELWELHNARTRLPRGLAVLALFGWPIALFAPTVVSLLGHTLLAWQSRDPSVVEQVLIIASFGFPFVASLVLAHKWFEEDWLWTVIIGGTLGGVLIRANWLFIGLLLSWLGLL
jgi:hypothetical protein